MGPFPGVSSRGKKLNHSPPSTAKVKNALSYASSPPVRLQGTDREKNLPLPLTEPRLHDDHTFPSTAKINKCVNLILLFPHTSLQLCAELNTQVTCYSYTIVSM